MQKVDDQNKRKRQQDNEDTQRKTTHPSTYAHPFDSLILSV